MTLATPISHRGEGKGHETWVHAPGAGQSPPGSKCDRARAAMLVSLVIPVYNEIPTLAELLRRCIAVDFPKEIVLVDDCSRDGSRELLQQLAEQGVGLLGGTPKNRNEIRVLFQEQNQGKGAALRRGFAEATGDIILVQDADLEYDPRDIPRVIQPILDGEADVVFGSRFTGTPRRVLYFWHTVLNNLLTTLSNMTSGLNLTDMETCYKAFRAEVLRSVEVEENRFGFEPEITAKVARGNWRIYEVPISYHGRTYEEGKKIGWKDGVRALYVIGKYALKR
ncbi:glycosyl transferase family 2 [Myxococcus fulvus 124B02]|nr:glycosyl transferase family 2 [Myxococcus fulvus 124B02]